MGSVKDLNVVESAYENKPGYGIFTFSDRYSVFDWGEMPDLIPEKGAALCMMAAKNFELMKEDGIKNHLRCVHYDCEGSTGASRGLPSHPSSSMSVDLAVVYRPVEREILDDDGNPVQAKRPKMNNKPWKEQRTSLEVLQEYYITEKEEQVEFIKEFAVNAESYDYQRFMRDLDEENKAVFVPEQPGLLDDKGLPLDNKVGKGPAPTIKKG